MPRTERAILAPSMSEGASGRDRRRHVRVEPKQLIQDSFGALLSESAADLSAAGCSLRPRREITLRTPELAWE